MRARAFAWVCLLAVAGCRKPEAPPAPVGPPRGAAAVDFAPPPVVYFGDLVGYLPRELPGYTLKRDEGSTGKYGEVCVSEAERVFHREGREVQLRIVDTTLAPALVKKIRAAVRDNYGKDAADPTAPILMGEAVGYVRFDEGEATAEANLVVKGDRFVVAVSTRGFDNTVELRRVTRELDLAGLAKLR